MEAQITNPLLIEAALGGARLIAGQQGETGATGPAGADGTDGVSPEVAITEITGGHTVTITDADHPSGQSFNVMDGTNGTNGTNGADGVSPVVTITSITGGHTVSITDATHPSGQSFNVMDGAGFPVETGFVSVQPSDWMQAEPGVWSAYFSNGDFVGNVQDGDILEIMPADREYFSHNGFTICAEADVGVVPPGILLTMYASAVPSTGYFADGIDVDFYIMHVTTQQAFRIS